MNDPDQKTSYIITIFEVRRPSVPLISGTSYVVNFPCDEPALGIGD
jgi:hypothetical protein